MAWSDAARRAALEMRRRKYAVMTPGQINKRLDQLDKKSSKLTDALIAAGRGHEGYGDMLRKKDPLALHGRYLYSRSTSLHNEIARRYGPGAPHRLPRGFKGSKR